MPDSKSNVTLSSGLPQTPPPLTNSNKPTIRALDGGTAGRTRNDFDAIALQPPTTTQNNSQENIPLQPSEQFQPRRPIHRRAKTEISPPPRASQRFYSHQSRSCPGISEAGLEDVDLHSTPQAKAPKSKLEEGSKAFANWFHGRSGSVNLGVVRSMTNFGSDPMLSTREMETGNESFGDQPQASTTNPSRSPNRLQKRLTPPSPLKQVTSSKAFSFFGSKTTPEEQKPQLPEPANDELLNLDIASTLFPSGSPDPSSPEAFKTLQENAENTLRKLQEAYKLRTFSLHETLADKRNQEEELEEANIRAQHIKKQLDGMAEKALEQDSAMRALAEELATEKQKRCEEEEVRKRSIILVKPSDNEETSDTHTNASTPNKIKRRSAGMLSSDSGFESGDESAAESVFSRKSEGWESPTTTISSRDLSPDITLPVAVPFASPTPPPNKVIKPVSAQQSTSAYDRVMKGITSTGLGGSFMGGGARSQKCSNCQGATSSEAWDFMDILKDENRFLKTRIGELETAVDGCLHLVGG